MTGFINEKVQKNQKNKQKKNLKGQDENVKKELNHSCYFEILSSLEINLNSLTF
jgi:hypothetical protein